MRKNILIAGAIVAGLILACIVGWGIFGSLGRSGSDSDIGVSQSAWAPPAAPQPEMVTEKVMVEAPMMDEGEGMSYNAPGLVYAAERLIIRTGNISMAVEDTRAAQASIQAMVSAMAGDGAFVVSSEEYGGTEGNQPYISMSIRIPAVRFDETMDRIAELAVNLASRNESAQDVTEEYVDLGARLESLDAARQRLLQIMQEARVTKDVLEAEQQLTQREAEIESIKGRMQYLEQSAALSSIWIELQPYILSQPVSEEWRPAETARQAVKALVEGLQGFGDFAIFFAIALLPWLVVIGLVIFVIARIVRWRARARRARRAQQAPDDQATD